MRTFIGIRLADGLRSAVVELCDELRRASVRVKWVEPENVHFTLRFLGETDDVAVPAIAESLKNVVSSVPMFSIELCGVGAFPNVKKPRVLWVGIEPADGPLLELKRAVDGALADHGFSPEEGRPFHPHVTLGRVKDSRVANVLTEPLCRAADTALGVMEVRDVAFIRSTLSPRGPQYTDLYRLQLGTT